jgi:hypothetical protein
MAFEIVPFEQCWHDDSFELVTGNKYRVSQEIQQRALLAVTSLQPDLLQALGYFPIKRHTPGDAPLSNANIAAAIRNAYAAASAAGGGIVLIPPGTWSMGHEEFVFTTSHVRDSVKIQGSGMDTTVLNWATPFTGTAFKFSGEASPGSFYTNGGISDLTINCDELDASNTGCAIHIEACINTQFRNITIRNFLGGAGFRSRAVGVDGTNQYIQLHNFTSTSNRINYDLQYFVNCQGYGVYASSAAYRDFLCDTVHASLYGGNIQTSAPIAIELVGAGGCRLTLFDYYYEGFCPLMLKMNVPSVTYNQVDIHGFQLNGAPAVFADIDQFNNLRITNLFNWVQATTVLKARNGAACMLINSGDPISQPGKFDLDAASAANLVCLGYGSPQYFGPRVVAARGYSLPSFATGSEPVSAADGDVVRDSTYDRPTVKTSSAWKRVAYADDENELSALLRPYCAEIIDPRIKRLRSIISGNVDVLTGLLHASSIAAPASGQRPVWNAADDFFGGQPSFSCAYAGDHFLQGTLAAPIAAGSRAGVFVVFRANVAGNDANRRLTALVDSSTQAIAIACGYADANNASVPYVYIIPAVGFGGALLGAASSDVYGHIQVADAEPVSSFYFDENAAVTTGDAGVTSHDMNRLTLGGSFDSLIFKGCDVTIAYAAALKQALPPELRLRATRIAMTKYGLR